MLNTIITHIVSLTFLTCVALFICGFLKDLYLLAAGLACFFYVSFLLASLIDNFLPRFRVKTDKKAVFITGCDHGFGLLLARRLDSLGFKVFAGCLNPQSKGVQPLKDTVSNNAVFVKIDVTSDDSVSTAQKFVENNLGDCGDFFDNHWPDISDELHIWETELWAIVNNAGVIERGELEWTPIEVYRKQFEVNTFGVVRVTQAFLPLLRKFKGRVVTMTSVGGRITFSGFAPYCMSKHATSSFCEGLRLEMAKFGVKVITVEPFSYKTGMTSMSNMHQSVLQTWSMSSDKFQNDVYNNDYVEVFWDSVRKFNEATTLSDLNQVVDMQVEAVSAISPHYSYVAGCPEFLLNLWFSRRLPKTIVDYYTRKFVTFDADLEKALKNDILKKNL